MIDPCTGDTRLKRALCHFPMEHVVGHAQLSTKGKLAQKHRLLSSKHGSTEKDVCGHQERWMTQNIKIMSY